ncbi:MAG: hypothetical protein JNN24_08565 [Hyphomicrobium zavarzinii]|uniref:hypothetical protein n=1 Tax=Hyphomicrobium zavarzinii TaxID=48292 RepID=UPI001A49AE0D|nr:hypothetical protein [Hyphomicrobium zavarzinii]MBL8845807.1 hypothetical protein [Hyphomicrobium zavarzinii]
MTEPLKIASAATLAGALASALALAGSASAFRLDADRLASTLNTLRLVVADFCYWDEPAITR